MLRIALTGGIASGKTTVSRLFEELGVPVIDTDLIARQLVEPGQPALARIVDRFGPSILLADGSLDRGQLRTRIFGRPADRQALEDILHPAIHREALARLDALHAPYALLVIPLLTESGGDWGQDRVLLVDAPRELQKSRLMARDRCSEEEAEAALSAQANRAQRLAIADDVIHNDGNEQLLRAAVEQLHERYRRGGSQIQDTSDN
jgi:dephospho-CoA kinase